VPHLAIPASTLLIVAAPAEARAVLRACDGDPALADVQWTLQPLRPGIELLVSGIGKVNAGAAVARLADHAHHARIISLGVAGALPGSDLQIGQAVAATFSVYADEGLLTPEGFLDCAALGFPLAPPPCRGSAFPAHPQVLALLAPLAHARGPIATVSTCSGLDHLAQQVRSRTDPPALAECMEGAAIAHIAQRLGIPSGELRLISNTTGDRQHQQWDLPRALDALTRVTGQLISLLDSRASSHSTSPDA
jgi:futalosine hydrolase